MAKFAVFFSYRPETWDQMLKKPGDRAAAVRDLASSLGGSMETLYFMFVLGGASSSAAVRRRGRW
jgi:uncharacterized protein with GYD domain